MHKVGNKTEGNALLHMVPVCIGIYLKSVLRYEFLILDPYHLNTLHLLEQDCEDPWLFFEAKMGRRAKAFEKHWCGLPNSMRGKAESSDSFRHVRCCKSHSTAGLLACIHSQFVAEFTLRDLCPDWPYNISALSNVI